MDALPALTLQYVPAKEYAVMTVTLKPRKLMTIVLFSSIGAAVGAFSSQLTTGLNGNDAIE
jgi:hypothetical protein